MLKSSAQRTLLEGPISLPRRDPRPTRSVLCPTTSRGSELDKIVLEGTSPLDLPRLVAADRAEALEFIRSYGYDLDIEQERLEVEEMHREAVSFLERRLCPAPRAGDTLLRLHPDVRSPGHLADLVVWASQRVIESERQIWACAILRVMHCISQANNVAISPYRAEIRRQILDPYRRQLHHLDSGLFLGRDFDAVPLVSVAVREEKHRDSLILKLLHKPDSLLQSVHDHIGIRLVTPNRCQALRALQYIRKQNLANFALITPGRSRNTLLTLDHGDGAPGAPNPYSSSEFHSIQFTCRQLIKICSPGAAPLRFYFPYEIQILDQENHYRSEHGESSHTNYRLRQLRSVRARVLGRLLRASDSTAVIVKEYL